MANIDDKRTLTNQTHIIKQQTQLENKQTQLYKLSTVKLYSKWRNNERATCILIYLFYIFMQRQHICCYSHNGLPEMYNAWSPVEVLVFLGIIGIYLMVHVHCLPQNLSWDQFRESCYELHKQDSK